MILLKHKKSCVECGERLERSGRFFACVNGHTVDFPVASTRRLPKLAHP